MKRLTRFAVALVAATLTLSAIVPPASAHGGGDDGDGDGWRTGLPIPGTLTAEGEHGIAAAAGKLEMRICAVDGLLLTKGEAAVSAESHGEVVEWLGLHVYFDFTGCAELGGWRVAALVVGSGLELDAVGYGFAYLNGDGSYSLNGDEPESWGDGSFIKIRGGYQEDEPTPDETEEPDDKDGEEEQDGDGEHDEEPTPEPDGEDAI